MHLFIFWGMLFLFVATALTTLQDHFGIPILYGPFYLYFFSLGIDLAGFVCAIGIVIAQAVVADIGKISADRCT